MNITSPDETASITLLGYQGPHFKKLLDILDAYPFAIDVSDPGLGKTYVAIALALQYDLDLVVVTEPTIIDVTWKPLIESTGYTARTEYISYGELSSRKGCNPKHGYLKRIDSTTTTKTGSEHDHVAFVPTAKWTAKVKKGILAVVDEAGSVKNVTAARTRAAIALVSSIVCQTGESENDEGTPSRVIYLSATPFTEEKQTTAFLRHMGIISPTEPLAIYNPALRIFELRAMKNLFEFCIDVAGETAKNYIKTLELKKGNVNLISFDVFTRFVMPALSSKMDNITHLPRDVANGFYKMTDLDEEELEKFVKDLAEAAQYEEGVIVGKRKNGNKLFSIIKEIEKRKVPKMAELAKKSLDSNPRCKVVLFVNNTQSVDRLQDILWDYNPLILNGEVKKGRGEIVDLFNEDSDEHRLLIGNLRMCSKGISLHDTSPEGRPRIVYGIPVHSFDVMHQATHRVVRAGMTTTATIRYIYSAKTGSIELGIINALAAKSKRMEKIIGEENHDLPIYYKKEIEPGAIMVAPPSDTPSPAHAPALASHGDDDSDGGWEDSNSESEAGPADPVSYITDDEEAQIAAAIAASLGL